MNARCRKLETRTLDLNGLIGWVSKFRIEQLTDSREHFRPVLAFDVVSVRGVPCDIGKHQAPSTRILHVVFSTTSCA